MRKHFKSSSPPHSGFPRGKRCQKINQSGGDGRELAAEDTKRLPRYQPKRLEVHPFTLRPSDGVADGVGGRTGGEKAARAELSAEQFGCATARWINGQLR